MTENGFELSFKYRFESAHRFTMSCADSCATPHGHTWYADAIFSSADDRLGHDDMVMEFSRLKKSWKSFVTETVDHSFMHHFEDPILPALREFIPAFRGLPFPGDPTTELIAALFLAKVQAIHAELKAKEPESRWPRPTQMIIQETPTNRIRYHAGRGDSATPLLQKINSEFDGWWLSADPRARHLSRRQPSRLPCSQTAIS